MLRVSAGGPTGVVAEVNAVAVVGAAVGVAGVGIVADVVVVTRRVPPRWGGAVSNAGLGLGHASPPEVRETAVGEEAEAACVAETRGGGAVRVGPADVAAAA